MSATVSRPRRAAREPTPELRSSAAVREAIDLLQSDRNRADDEVYALEKARPEILKSGTDEQAEQHDAAIARAKRAIERADLQRPDLEAELARAEAREEAERVAKLQAEAEAAIKLVVDDIEEHYRVPARTIGAFMARWNEANALASKAGVDSIDTRLRYKPGIQHPDVEDTYSVYIDENGQDTSNPYPPGMYFIDPETKERFYPARPNRHDPMAGGKGEKVQPRRRERRTRTVKGHFTPGIALGSLTGQVNLPGAVIGDPLYHGASDLEDRKPEHERRYVFG